MKIFFPVFNIKNQFIIDEGLNSFLITDDLFKKTIPKPEAPKPENKNEEKWLKNACLFAKNT